MKTSIYIKKDIFLRVKPIKRVEKQKYFFTDDEIVNMRDACQNVYLDSNAKKHLIDYLNTRNDYSKYLFTNNKKKIK